MDHLPVMTTSARPVTGLPDAPDALSTLLPGFAGAVGSGFIVQLDAFAGPLDLLLHLLREEQLDIADIPIARIADQFLVAIHHLGLKDRKSTRLNSSHRTISYAVFCLKKKMSCMQM